MRTRNWVLGCAAIAAGAAISFGDEPAFYTAPVEVQAVPQQPERVAPPVRPSTPPVQPPANPAAAAANQPQFNMAAQDPSTNMPMLRGAPRMIGDFPGYYGCSTVTQQSTLTTIVIIPTIIRDPQNPDLPPITVPVRTTVQADVTEQFKFATLALSRGAFKIAENESPVPQDRFYVSYNYFSQVAVPPAAQTGTLTLPPGSPLIGPNGAGPFPLRNTLANTIAGTGPLATLTEVNVDNYDVHRETVGFEKTFLCGQASVGVRLPVFQSSPTGNSAINATSVGGFNTFPSTVAAGGFGNNFDGSRVGDVSVILKYAFIQNPDANRVVSAGLVTTAPTGGGIPLADGSQLYSTLLQPFVGGVQSYDNFYVHGFSSIAVPTDDRDITMMFNDLGVGVYLYRCPDAALITQIIPTFEAHLSTPLDNGAGGITAYDALFLTGGVHVGLGQRSVLTFAVATPVTGPRPNQFEAAVQFNFLF